MTDQPSDKPSPFPHSAAYLARQAARQKALDALHERKTWTDAQFLAERDATYVAQQRAYIAPAIVQIEHDMRDGDDDPEGCEAFYHTDIG